MSVGDHEANIVGDGADISDVIVIRSSSSRMTRMNCARSGISISDAFPSPGRTPRRGRTPESPETLSARNTALVNGEIFEELLGSLMRVEHAQLQVEDGLAGHGEVEVAGLDDAGVNGADRNLEDAFTVSGPIDVPLAFKRGQNGVERKILAQRMHIGPVIVERHSARIGMPCGFESEPILNFAFLPIDGGLLRCQRRERGMVNGMGALRITQDGSPTRSKT